MYLDVKKVGFFARITAPEPCEGENPITLKVIMCKKLLFGCEKSRNYTVRCVKNCFGCEKVDFS